MGWQSLRSGSSCCAGTRGVCAGLDDPAGLEWCWQGSSGTAWLFDLSPWLPLLRLLCVPGREAMARAADGHREQGGVSWPGAGSDWEPSSRSHRALAGLIHCLHDPSTAYSNCNVALYAIKI